MNNRNCTEIFKRPTRNFRFDTKLKKAARDQVYFDHTKTFYCDCDFIPTPNGASGVIDPSNCGYQIKNLDSNRGKKLEWEHIVPASVFGKHRSTWINHKENEVCGVKSKSGRERWYQKIGQLYKDKF